MADSFSSGTEGDSFSIFIRTVAGEMLNVSVQPDTDILAIKSYLQGETGVEVSNCSLTCNAQDLENSKTFQDYHIVEGSTLVQSITLPGGKCVY